MNCPQKHCPDCGSAACCQGRRALKEIRLSRPEADFLLRFAELPFLPAAEYHLQRFGAPETENDRLAPVFLEKPSDSLETIRKTARLLQRLSELGLISISYTEPLGRFNYADYVNAPAFTEFCSQAEGYTIPEIEYGSMALSLLGQEVIDDLELTVLPPRAAL